MFFSVDYHYFLCDLRGEMTFLQWTRSCVHAFCNLDLSTFAPSPALPRRSLRSLAGEGAAGLQRIFAGGKDFPPQSGVSEGGFGCKREALEKGKLFLDAHQGFQHLSHGLKIEDVQKLFQPFLHGPAGVVVGDEAILC